MLCVVYGCTDPSTWEEGRKDGDLVPRPLCDHHKAERDRAAGPHMKYTPKPSDRAPFSGEMTDKDYTVPGTPGFIRSAGGGWRVWALTTADDDEPQRCFIQQPDGSLAVNHDGSHLVAESYQQAVAAVKMLGA
jgi:hypothetical protein